MNKQNLEKLERELEKKLRAREKRKNRPMKVSGGSVKKLQRILVSPKL
jgi:hypothetical protein